MKIRLSELGAIKEGSIDLSKRLNIFCGPNGTGKTYVAYAIYGMLKTDFHIGSNREVIKDLIENKKAIYKFNFTELNSYRDEILTSFMDDLDTLFGVSDDFIKLNFNENLFLVYSFHV